MNPIVFTILSWEKELEMERQAQADHRPSPVPVSRPTKSHSIFSWIHLPHPHKAAQTQPAGECAGKAAC
jgi:hypothetical protein